MTKPMLCLDFARQGSGGGVMAPENPEIDKLLHQLWTLLDLANTTATAHDCVEQLDQVAALCDEAARIARKTVALR